MINVAHLSLTPQIKLETQFVLDVFKDNSFALDLVNHLTLFKPSKLALNFLLFLVEMIYIEMALKFWVRIKIFRLNIRDTLKGSLVVNQAKLQLLGGTGRSLQFTMKLRQFKHNFISIQTKVQNAQAYVKSNKHKGSVRHSLIKSSSEQHSVLS